MTTIPLAKAKIIIEKTLETGRTQGMNPLSVAVLDAGGHLIAFERSDGASAGRFQFADGKANAALMLGIPTSAIMAHAEKQPHFSSAMSAAFQGRFIPLSGGVLVTDEQGQIIGAVGVTGDTSENDAIVATAGVQAAGFTPIA